MGKNKKTSEQRRQKKRLDRRTTRKDRQARFRQEQAAKKNRTRKLAQAAEVLADGTSIPDITEDEYIFWLCHGCNYLASNKAEGVWDPLFEGIYAGHLPDVDAIPLRVTERFRIDSDEPLTSQAKAVLVWSVTEKAHIRIYKHEAERRILEADPEADAAMLAARPHNPVVWGLMDLVMERILESGQDED